MARFTYEDWLAHIKKDRVFDESMVKRDDRGRFTEKPKGSTSGGLSNEDIMKLRTKITQIPEYAHPSVKGINDSRREASERMHAGAPSASIELEGKDLFNSRVRALANKGKKIIASIIGKVYDIKAERKARNEFETLRLLNMFK